MVHPKSDVFKKIPLDALEFFEKLYDKRTVESLIEYIRRPSATFIRVNTLLTDVNSILTYYRQRKVHFKAIPFLPDCFMTDKSNEKMILKSTPVAEGKVYLQSLSSQLPVHILSPVSGENVLDMAAAPGSKTSQIATFMKNAGVIDAIEPDYVRFERLKSNIQRQGIKIVDFHNLRAEKFRVEDESLYDRVLVDAPCSGEGRFKLDDKSSYLFWSIKEVRRLSKIQLKLLSSALRLCKSGGVVVYSTCTLNPLENEKVVSNALIESEGRVSLVKQTPDLSQHLETLPIFKEYEGEVFHSDVKKCLRIKPSEKSEGFFIAKFVKK